MKNIKCTIIQDILPLYVDEVVSEDTKEMVDEHLQHCTNCQQEYAVMQQQLFIPIEAQDPILHKLSKKWRTKKVKIALASIVGTAVILFGIFRSRTHFKRGRFRLASKKSVDLREYFDCIRGIVLYAEHYQCVH